MGRISKIVAVTALAVGLGVALLIGVVWTPDRPLASLTARWAQPPSRFVTVDGVAVHLRDEGPADDPHPLVLLHGTASSLHTWQGWAEALRARHRVIRFDLPGAGLSGPFPDDDYRMAHYVRFTADLLDRLGIRRATLVGNSLGGYVAWETTLARPDLADRLVLVDARGYPDAGPPSGIERVAQIPILGPLVIEHITPRGQIEGTIRSVFGDPRRLTPAQADAYYELLLRAGNRRALRLQTRQLVEDDSARIRAIAVPTLILWGARDPRVPVANGERFHKDIAGSQLVVLPGLGHTPQEEDAAQSARALETFLATEPGRPER